MKVQEEIKSIHKIYQEREAKQKNKLMKNKKVIENAHSTIVAVTKQYAKDLNMIKKMNKLRYIL